MVLQGPGAGLKITAAGVFADLLRLSRSLVSFNVPVKMD
jgi:homoserine dehydrogenase